VRSKLRGRTIAFAALAVTVVACGSVQSSRSKDGGLDGMLEASSPETSDDTATPEASFPYDGPCPSVGMVNFGGPTCNTCAATHCCSLGTACYGTGKGSCAQLANCIADCDGAEGDAGGPGTVPGCTDDCDKQYASGEAAYNALNACISMACRTDAGTGPCDP
jgi:hypothetical protein